MLPNAITQDKIIALEKAQQERFHSVSNVEEYRRQKEAKRCRQLEWLAVFEQTLSPKVASQRTGTNSYHSWRSSDPEFCKLFNKSLANVRDEMYGVAIGRAIGYRPYDEEGNPATDADGKAVYERGSDKLMMAFLGMNEKAEGSELAVTIEIVSRRDKDVVCEQG